MGVLFPPLQSNCFPVTVAVSCSNLVLKKKNDSSFMYDPAGSKAHGANHIPQRVSQCLCHSLCFHLRHLFYEFLLPLISSSSPHQERVGTVVVCGDCVCAFCGSRYQTGREKKDLLLLEKACNIDAEQTLRNTAIKWNLDQVQMVTSTHTILIIASQQNAIPSKKRE